MHVGGDGLGRTLPRARRIARPAADDDGFNGDDGFDGGGWRVLETSGEPVEPEVRSGRGLPDGWQEPVEGVWRFAAPATEEWVPRSRHAVRDLLRAQGIEQDREEQADFVAAVLLIVSELVTNAVRHAAVLSPQIVIEVVIGGGWLRVSVEDNHPYRPTALQNDFGRTNGRGLLLVKTMAETAGGSCDVERTVSGGKIIWAALPLPEPSG
jgi:anti-sigma regulatory factor (Ser/Thr protein kinase)